MNSLDSNILLYALNKDCPENESGFSFLKTTMRNPEEWIISDQVFFELYGLMRNPAVLEKPLSAEQAYEIIDYYRNKVGWQHCSYKSDMWQDMASFMQKKRFSSKRIFDLQLAVTLKNNAVTTFYTRNTKDFNGFSWLKVIDPFG